MSDADNDTELDYSYLAQNALRGVVREVLSITQALGMPPGEHHFYIEFVTTAEGVQLSDRLRAEYPEKMTIVLQHQFEGLHVHEDCFEVRLHFQGIPDQLVIPYAAITQFADPSVNFALQFPHIEAPDAPIADEPEEEAPPRETDAEVANLTEHREAASKDSPAARKADTEGDDGDGDDDPSGGGADVVSLDRFRKK